MKVYIAGKITGRADYASAFAIAENKLSAQGFITLNPASLPEGMDKPDYMRICFSMIDSADVVALLPGWETSPGARLEYEYCEYIGKPARSLELVLNWKGTIYGS